MTSTEHPWLTALLRPVGDLDQPAADQLDGALQALTPYVSLVVLDLDAARVGSPRATEVLAAAAGRLGQRGGVLLLVNVHESDLALVSGVEGMVVVADEGALLPA